VPKPAPAADGWANPNALKARYRRITRFAALALAQTWWFEIILPRLGLAKLAERSRIKRATKIARRFHDLALDLGGLMIKVGQFLSARIDVLPVEITRELEGLQDKVAPDAFDKILSLIERELDMPASVAFLNLETTPIAAASLGQAYRATLSTGLADELGFSDVIVKVLRPGIEEIVEVDLKALRKIGGWLARVKLVSKRTDAPALVEEFAKTTLEEIDYFHETQNLERFAADFAGDARVTTPSVVWERSARRVLTLSDVTAIKISDVDALVAAGLDPNAVAAELARVTFEQFFVTGFFHADPHPGNIFVTPTPAGADVDFALTYIDFGMMGQISEELRANLQRFIFAVAARDARGWVAACERLGVLLPSADTVVLERAISELFERFGGVGVSDLVQIDPSEFRDFAIKFNEILRTLPFQLPNNFLFLLRAISLISGVTSSLNREFNMWDAVDPFARTLLNGGGASTLKRFGKDALSTLNTLARLPQRLDSLATRAERGELVMRNPELEQRVRSLDSSVRRATSAVIFVGLLIAGVVLNATSPALSTVMLSVSVLPLVHALGIGRLNK
jgi:predicted unusual protein kinase regulating ubiquinone biosynthesis (AarF/ABC1/UbiB family)